MKVQLLLLLALVGPFCAFTSASPTTLPIEVATAPDAEITPDISSLDSTEVVTGPPPTLPEAAPKEEEETDAPYVFTEKPVVETEVPSAPVVPEDFATEAPAAETEAPAAETEAPDVETEASDVETEPPAGETEAPVVETEAPAEVTAAPAVNTVALPEETAAPASGFTAPTEETGDKEGQEGVVIDDTVEEQLSAGQIVGIVIGALLAVIIVIAVVIAVVRRMGKYTPAKSKKPAKKESVMVSPLKKKSTKQQERAKFWKI